MAKVTAPLLSAGASGKIFDALVFFPWKGKSLVREWKIPANPKTGKQGDVRLILGGLGRAVKPVSPLSPFAAYCREVTPSGQTWVSRFVQFTRTTHKADSTAYEAQVTAFEAHTAKTDFDDEAADLLMTAFDIPYKLTASDFDAGHQLYCLAQYGCDQYNLDNLKFPVSPFTTALADWTLTEIQSMVALFAAP